MNRINSKSSSNSHTKSSISRRHVAPLTVIILGIRLFVVLFAVCLTGWLIHNHGSTDNPVTVAGALASMAMTASTVAGRITDLSTLLL